MPYKFTEQPPAPSHKLLISLASQSLVSSLHCISCAVLVRAREHYCSTVFCAFVMASFCDSNIRNRAKAIAEFERLTSDIICTQGGFNFVEVMALIAELSESQDWIRAIIAKIRSFASGRYQEAVTVGLLKKAKEKVGKAGGGAEDIKKFSTILDSVKEGHRRNLYMDFAKIGAIWAACSAYGEDGNKQMICDHLISLVVYFWKLKKQKEDAKVTAKSLRDLTNDLKKGVNRDARDSDGHAGAEVPYPEVK